MGRYRLVYTKNAKKDLLQKVAASKYKTKVVKLLQQLENDPFAPPVEKLQGDLSGFYSRRVNIQHRIVYRVEKKVVMVYSVWSHYE